MRIRLEAHFEIHLKVGFMSSLKGSNARKFEILYVVNYFQFSIGVLTSILVLAVDCCYFGTSMVLRVSVASNYIHDVLILCFFFFSFFP